MTALNLTGPSDRFFFAGGYDYLGTCGELSAIKFPKIEAETINLVGPACTVDKMIPSGFKKVDGLSFTAWYQSATLAKLKSIRSLSVTERVSNWGIEGLATGRNCFGKQMIDKKWAPKIEAKDLTKVEIELIPATGSLDFCKVLVANVQKTGTTWNTQSDSVDNTTSSASGAACYVQVTDVSLGGGTGSVVLVKHSTDNTTFTTLATFTTITASPTAERVTVTGTVNRYLATSGSYTGSPTSPTTTVFVAVARG